MQIHWKKLTWCFLSMVSLWLPLSLKTHGRARTLFIMVKSSTAMIEMQISHCWTLLVAWFTWRSIPMKSIWRLSWQAKIPSSCRSTKASTLAKVTRLIHMGTRRPTCGKRYSAKKASPILFSTLFVLMAAVKSSWTNELCSSLDITKWMSYVAWLITAQLMVLGKRIWYSTQRGQVNLTQLHGRRISSSKLTLLAMITRK